MIATIAVLLLLPALHQPAQTSPRQLLSGTWTFNTEASDKPGLNGGRGGAPSGGGAGAGGGRRGGARGGGGGGGGNDSGSTPLNPEDLKMVEAMLTEVLQPPLRMTITVLERDVTFTEANGREVRLTTDNKKQKQKLTGGTAEIRTRWDGASLVRETSLLGLAKVKEIYSVTPTNQLRVDVTLERARTTDMPAFKRIYDRPPAP